MTARTIRKTSRLVAAIIGISLTTTLVACGSGTDDDDHAAGTSGTPAASDYYPHTQTTAYGDTTIEAQPERIVALTTTAADELLALGITPAAVGTDPDQLDTTAPWIADDIRDTSDADLVANARDINVESVANTEPDLLIGAPWQFGDASVWERVNAIAPTIIPESSDTNVGWEASLRTTAEAVGMEDKAEEIISDVKGEYKNAGGDVAAEKTYNFTGYTEELGFFSGNGSVFQLFGLSPSDSQDDSQTKSALSVENTDQLTGDLLAVYPQAEADRKALDSNQAFQQLPAVKNGTVYYADAQDAYAINTAGPHSLRWFLDRITPTIEKLD
ncbi:hypothetical protein BJF89_17350 [Corynebacterium sp. CNJ-954]|uniref:ABC transporter substrate-binding protein n=1 Tax=Corynebacterium sp. CNJ-954 TaxID=1904962 RepID=UPI000966DF1F|nr:ABC transporter substrate-binding protein [Corynebacterium sp. CNJ-954]OLT54102.1 hypothetical protein BJF89_17350 [Corynebacterium sp. CNJ-954]